MANKWTKMLSQYEDVVKYDYDAFAPENCIYTPSPYINWIFANKSHGIPKGSSVLFFSEPKSGKTLIMNAISGQVHQDQKDGIVVYFNTEMRGKFQNGMFKSIDTDRLVMYDSNKPEDVFDRFERDIIPMVQDGMPLAAVVIDSLTSIGGTKSMTGDRSVNDHLIGDRALTIQKGLQKMVPFLKANNITLLASSQVRANIDGGQYGPKEKMAASYAERHAFEYFVNIRRAGSADDKADIEGNKFEDDTVKDARGNKDQTGHKIYFKMEQSSIGTAGRSGIITLDYKEGIINQHEEVFDLGKNHGLIKTLGAGGYEVYGEKIRGKAEVAKRIKESKELFDKIIADIKAMEKKD
jgi:RecA/RadA recombinase